MPRFIVLATLPFVLAGCVSNEVVDCSPPFDPDAQKIPAVVQAKRIADPSIEIVDGKWDGTVPEDVKNHRVVGSPGELSAIGPAGGLGAIGGYYLLNALGPKQVCGEVRTVNQTVYEYDVLATSGQKYRVWSFYPAFENGQCVNIFLSSKPDQFTPRLASGSDCGNG